MAPKPPGKTSTKNRKNNDAPPKPPQNPADGPHVDYAEVQADEIAVLQAIYMEDYEEVEVKSAWSKSSDRAFKLKLKAPSDDSTFIILSAKLTATYPKSAPVLQVEGLDRLQAHTKKRIQKVIKTKPVEMAGEVMMYPIAEDIQDALEDAVVARETGVLPSLEDERMNQEAAAFDQAKEAQEDEAKKLQAAQDEEKRTMDRMVSDELERRAAKQRDRSSRTRAKSHSDPMADDNDNSNNIVNFDQDIALSPGVEIAPFSSVTLISSLASKGQMGIFAAQPKFARNSVMTQTLLAVRRLSLKIVHGDAATKNHLLVLEDELEQLKVLRQPNIVNVYAFKVEKNDGKDGGSNQDWDVSVLTDLANRGSLAEMLEDGQTIPPARAKQWALDLLEALEYYHRHGIVHKRIHSANVLLFRSDTGVTAPKLADAAYEDRLLRLQGRASTLEKGKKMAAWLAPECSGENPAFTSKSDVWDFGVLLVQMLFGTAVTRKYNGPVAMLESLDLSDPLSDVLRRLFSKEPKNRPGAFEAIPSEFFRSDLPIINIDHSTSRRRQSSSMGFSGDFKSPIARRSRQNSLSVGEGPSFSRYVKDFTELGRLGKGGFGEVVKARNKLDGGVYAVKKVKQDSAAQLEHVLSEVMLLHRLNHAYVVRYYSAWVEDDLSGMVELDQESVSFAEDTTTSSGDGIQFGMSSRGLDFVSSSGLGDDIVFGEDSGDDTEEDDEEDDDVDDDSSASGTETNGRVANGRPIFHREAQSESAISDGEDTDSRPQRTHRASSRRFMRSTLYIQMEYCERHTLRDLIRKGMYTRPEEGWQMLRQVLEGLAHIHNHGIIHRDLKPDNVFIDAAGNPRIGDFGLATTSQYANPNKTTPVTNTGAEMTRSVGTAMYVAPEIKSGSGVNYNDKVDMYSLGIIFFEMCHPLKTAMERHEVLLKMREKEHVLPPEFQAPEKVLQGNVIMDLISHSPGDRPSSMELLRSGKLPVQIEDETIRQTLQSLTDPGSQYYQKMMTALFTQTSDQRVKDFAWDAKLSKQPPTADDLRVRDIARNALCSIFRRHGAEETQRPLLLPRSSYYTAPNIVQLLDGTGNLLQLPYDLVLPHARRLAKHEPAVERTFVFGNVYRDTLSGGPPRNIKEVDFDIVTKESDDLVLQEAEVLKVIDEIVDEIPALSSQPMCFHLNHSDLLELILDFCRIDKSQRPVVKETLSKLNIHQFGWSKIRAELRSPLIGIHSTSLDDLAQFDFRDTPEKALKKLQDILEGSTHISRIRRPMEHIKRVIDAMKLFGIRRKIYICPLSSFNEKFYTGSVLFQCIYDKKNRNVFAAGGRYDRLIDAHRSRAHATSEACHAVGVSIGWDGLIAAIIRHRKNSISSAYLKKGHEELLSPAWNAKRCDILVASGDPTVLRSIGIKVLASLWANDFSAELATDARTIDDVLSKQRDASHPWIVMVKHEASSTFKVRNSTTDTETEVASTNLISHMRSELRERESREAGNHKSRHHPSLLRHSSHHNEGNSTTERAKNNVQVLMAQHRGKKSNKYHIVEAAQSRWAQRIDEWKTAPILAIEGREGIIESIRDDTRLSDPDSWRKLIQSTPLAERQYLAQVHELLLDMRKKWEAQEEGATREACIFNFRTGNCVYYDVGL
ncbi:Serine/threonine-protein kinase [Aureobasidium pullulans]|uniref:non-specific serine/threonine protein kinase n=1 Tax=Aureobasidium pullulans TaxID=5580 RepID=A0AB74JMH6_AURPU|nr:Serine/threonine-protein kinase [Aureobasidium pullulans]THX63250.1 Serine/threonine-protein kinase [Aureobasidium pullulans]